MVTFYKLDDNGHPSVPVLYLDTLKVSTIEQTADEATANGGKGNVALISWDYNKDINVTIEDALFSAKSMAIMFGDGTIAGYDNDFIMKTEVFTASADVTGSGTDGQITAVQASGAGWSDEYIGPGGYKYPKINPKFFEEDNDVATSFEDGKKYFCTYDLLVKGSVIRIGADSFPGTYYVVGDTWARPQAGGEDEFFQFIIPKAKVLSENTITLEADGDPSVFNFNLHVLRPESGDMMQLVKYDLVGGVKGEGEDATIYHNHTLLTNNEANTNTDKETYTALAGSGSGTTTELVLIVDEGASDPTNVGTLTAPVTIKGAVPEWLTITVPTEAGEAVTAEVAANTITENKAAIVTFVKGDDRYDVTFVASNAF